MDVTIISSMKPEDQGKKNMDRSQNYYRATNFSPFDNYKVEAPKQDIV